MSVSFDQIPGDIRTYGQYIEFNAERAGAVGGAFRRLVFGQKLAAGNAAANVPLTITRIDEAKRLFGQGSMIARMCAAMLSADRTIELTAIPQDDAVASAAATGSVTFTGVASDGGMLVITLGGDLVRVFIAKSLSAADIASVVAGAITSDDDLLVSAVVNGSDDTKVDLTAKNKGESGNDIEIGFYWDVNLSPASPTLAVEAMSGGAGNPDIAPALTAMGETHYHWMVSPYTDAQNLTKLETELLDRWGPMEQIDGTAFAAFRGNHSESTTFGNSRNWHGICTMGTNLSPQYPPLWAATVCASAASALAIDPARPLQTLRLRSLLPPAAQLRWRRAERDVLLHNGVSTYRVGDDGTVTIERLVTMYQKNAQGYEDAAYLDLNTVETLRRIRMRQRQHIGSTYPRHKLAADGTDYPSGQPIVTPSLIKGALIALYQEFIDLGWVEDLDGYQETLHVEIDADDKNRVNFVDNPNLINQFRILAGKTQFEV